MKKKHFKAAALIATALCFCTIMIFVNASNNDEISLIEADGNIGIENDMTIESNEDDSCNKNDTRIEVSQETENIVAETPVPTVEQKDTPTPTASEINNAFATLKITTSKKIGTYTVMPDVDEDTLRDNIGWLPSSSFPGEEGVCVFMGHRDTDFRILKYVEVGDAISVYTDNFIYNYKVTKTEIINSDSELKFEAISDSNLVLVTCYPFYYSGHAPKKFIVYCIFTNL